MSSLRKPNRPSAEGERDNKGKNLASVRSSGIASNNLQFYLLAMVLLPFSHHHDAVGAIRHGIIILGKKLRRWQWAGE